MKLFLETAERFKRTIRSFLKKSVFEKGDANSVDVLHIITKNYYIKKHPFTKLTPSEGNFKKNEGSINQKFLHKRKKTQPKYRRCELVRTADLKRFFSKADKTNWCFMLFEIAENINGTITRYRAEDLTERYDEALLEKAKLTLKENERIMKALILK